MTGGISTTSETNSGALTVQGSSTLGTNSSNTLTVNSASTFNQPPTMSGANITANTIPTSAINGGVSVSLSPSLMTVRKTSTQVGYVVDMLPSTGYWGGLSIANNNWAFNTVNVIK